MDLFIGWLIDWYSRKVRAWRLSNTIDSLFCVDCWKDALNRYDTPEILNTDQGSQFTRDVFIQVLKKLGINISMDGRGRALDTIFVERLWRSVKYEDVYLKGYHTITEVLVGLTHYFNFYNRERPHQSLNYGFPDEVVNNAVGGWVLMVDKYPKVKKKTQENIASNQDMSLSVLQ